MKLFYIVLFSCLFSQNQFCSVKTKSSTTIRANNVQTDVKKNVQPHVQEAEIIQEIKSLLKGGRVPSLSFNQWVDTHGPILLTSNKQSVQKLGETLQAIRQGNTANISAFKVLPSFEKAVQEYDPKFRISLLTKPVIIAKGTYWYFSAPKKMRNT